MDRSRLAFTFFNSPHVPLVLQSEAAECGLACLAMVAGYHGFGPDLPELRRRWKLSLKGTGLAHLIGMAGELRLTTRALRLEPGDFRELRLPAILHWNLDHFVVLERVSRNDARIVDPACGRRKLTLTALSKHFTGVALELRPAAGFERRPRPSRLPLAAFVRRIDGLPAALLKILLLSVALQAFVLAAPLFGQIVIDEVVISHDRNMLLVLGTSFLLLAAIQAGISAGRGWLIIVLGAHLHLGWSARLFHHLIRLPLDYFERRHMGDIVSRFSSTRALESLLSGAAVEAVVDGLMTITTLAVMIWYHTTLTAIAVAAVLLYWIVRALLFGPLRSATRELLASEARADSRFMESVRAILPIKTFALEAIRETAWQNSRAQAVHDEVRVQRLELIQQQAAGVLFAAENVAVLWVGAFTVIDGELSLGMLVAFLAYKNQFAARAAALIDKCLEFRLVDVHLDRIADIALAERDVGSEASAAARTIVGQVQTKDLYFRYADADPCVLNGVNLTIEPAECVALSGPSGFGKTTLIKLLMGLLEPDSGSIFVDGRELHRGMLGDYRRQIAAVMQDDLLLSGTLADNICFFDPEPDQQRIESCARLAAIHEDILRMPIGYLTSVGELGSALSGGQRQRVLLARALYRRPRLLFLDEATSHLDAFTEHRIHQALRDLNITRVIVAHRQETLAVADRIIQLPHAEKAG
jgi:ATP-binding cassette subfamily B protein RaxB